MDGPSVIVAEKKIGGAACWQFENTWLDVVMFHHMAHQLPKSGLHTGKHSPRVCVFRVRKLIAEFSVNLRYRLPAKTLLRSCRKIPCRKYISLIYCGHDSAAYVLRGEMEIAHGPNNEK